MMNNNFSIRKVSTSRLPDIDFDNIPFGQTFSDHMFVADYIDGKWTNMQIVPFGDITISPINLAIHYGQSIFEGMKATKKDDGTPCFFRPEEHAKRMNKSAERMCMPAIPEELFLEALHALVNIDSNWIPEKEGSALYLRPVMFANDAILGVKVSKTYKFIVVTGPVGPYYPKPVKLLAETKYIRAAEGGVGAAKTAGNYAASLLPAKNAIDQGYDQVLWLDAKEFKYIKEVGTMNLFFVIDGKVITPTTGDTVLKGITRDSILTILRDKGYVIEERAISIDEVLEADKKGTLQEIFGTGTAAIVANVSHLKYKDTVIELPAVETHKTALMLRNEINKIRSGEVADKYNWVVPVAATLLAEVPK